MDYSIVNKYELKSPSYELKDRSYPIDPKFKENSRYLQDDSTGIYRSKAGDKDEVSILLTGDLLCQENMLNSYRTQDGFDFSLCFEYIRPLLKSSDLAVGNLETPVSHTAPYRGEIITHEGPYYCNAPLRYLEDVAWAGFDMLYTANNHTLDAGARGLLETIENTRNFGMMQTGTFAEKGDKFIIIDVCGFKVGFVSFSGMDSAREFTYNSMDDNLSEEGKDILLNSYSLESAKEIYAKMKASGAEYTVVLPHWGKEYHEKLHKHQLDIAKDLTALGYDLIVGCHPHVVQKASIVNGKPVFYSVGNLISHIKKASVKERASLTVLFNLKLKRVNGAVEPAFSVIPCKILKNCNGIPFSVVPAIDLSYPPEVAKKVKGVSEKVAKIIESDAFPVMTSYPITKIETAAFSKSISEIPEKLKKLLPAKEPPAGIKKPILSIENDRGNVYVEYEDHAELVTLSASSSLTTYIPPDTINGKPITVFNSYSTGNDRMKLLYLPKPLQVIGPGLLRDYAALESVRSFGDLRKIGAGAFENCVSVTGLIFSTKLEIIEDFAFRGCKSLLSIKLPANVSYIADNAFEGCDKLTIYCVKNSYADKYAKTHNISVKYMTFTEPADYKASGSLTALKIDQEKYKPFRGAAVIPENAAEIEAIRKTLPPVQAGPMNGPDDRHPKTIIEVCQILGHPLPEDATCGYQPSHYIGRDIFDGTLSSIIGLLGNKMPKVAPDKLASYYSDFRRKYQSQECLDRNAVDFTVYFVDWLLFVSDIGYSHNDYFDFEFYNKEREARDTFIGQGLRGKIANICNERSQRKIYIDKGLFNSTYAKYVKRDWLDTTSCSLEEFTKFLSKHSTFFGKPIRGTGGYGAMKISRDSDTPENLYEFCKNNEFIVEELIEQHPDLAKVNASTLNTVRVYTLVCADGTPRITLTVARFGRSGNVVDNFHGGGVGAIVDIDTGVIISEAINRAHLRSPIHPDSKVALNGFVFPEWEKLKAAVCDAALIRPDMRHIGWDVAVTQDGEIEFVEGNSRGNIDVLQSPDQLGRKYRYYPYIDDIEAVVRADAARKPRYNPRKPHRYAPIFAGAPVQIENEAELNEIRKSLPSVKMGPMNGPEEKHPATIIETCKLLGCPLPEDAVCGHEPSFYLGDIFDGRRTPMIKALGNNMPKIDEEELKVLHKDFLRRYQQQCCLDRNGTNFTVYFADYILHALELGFSHHDYFDFELYNKETDIRNTFVSEQYRLNLTKICRQDSFKHFFKSKRDFNTKFADFIKRDWLDTTTCSLKEFKEFAKKHEKFIAKPFHRSGGHGICIVDTTTDSIENIFAQCKSEGVLAEELIKQHKKLAEINESTLNTVRVVTLLDADNTPHVLLAVARFGRKGNFVDNFHSDGVGAILDVDSGCIITEAINQSHLRLPIHPDSRIPILGFEYPCWEQIKATAMKAALVVPEVRHVGWDFAVREDGEIVLVEGNSRSGFDVLQSPDQVGRKYLYEKFVADIEADNKARAEAKRKAKAAKKADKPKKKKTLMQRIKGKIKRMLK